MTHPGILPRPLSPADAVANASALLARSHIRTPGKEEGSWSLFRSVTEDRARGNQVPDAHLVALMRQHGVGLIYTRDRDLRAYEGIEARDPFA